jgi:DNA-binding HxlR family transcriptional regulator
MLEADKVVRRVVYQQVPPKVEYCLTKRGQAAAKALGLCLSCVDQRP